MEITSEEFVALANKEIAKLTSYGVRTVTPEVKSRAFYWSNGSGSWAPSWIMPKGKQDRLDANYLMLPYVTDKVAWTIVEEFDPLPLFRNSFEAVWEGKKPANGRPMPQSIKVDLAPNQIVTLEDIRSA